MKVLLLAPEKWEAIKEKLIAFAKRHGEKRLTAAGLALLRKLDPQKDTEAGIAVAICDDEFAGFAFILDNGKKACLIVVREDMRGRGIGCALLRALCIRYGAIECKVATDNTASIQMCFRAGMKAVSLEQGPTGKPTLRFESGR